MKHRMVRKHRSPRNARSVRKPFAAVAAVLAVAATLSTTPAFASAVPVSATGATTLTLGGKAYNTLQTSGCGPLVATSANGVTVTPVTKGLKLILPISGLQVQPDSGAIRLDHSGSVTLENSCYAITLGTFRITDFGSPSMLTAFDLSAVTKSVDDSGRQVIGSLDLSTANVTVVGTKIRVAQMVLNTSAEGAEELNQLAVGGDGSSGPFVAGQKIGSAKTRVVLHF